MSTKVEVEPEGSRALLEAPVQCVPSPRAPQPSNPTVFGLPIKYLSCSLFVVQNVAVVIMLRYTRSVPAENKFLPSTAVICAEAIKLILSAVLTYRAEGSLESSYANKAELAKTSVPALLYLIQNNVIYFAASK